MADTPECDVSKRDYPIAIRLNVDSSSPSDRADGVPQKCGRPAASRARQISGLRTSFWTLVTVAGVLVL